MASISAANLGVKFFSCSKTLFLDILSLLCHKKMKQRGVQGCPVGKKQVKLEGVKQ
jgi:hypothetical protein